MPMNISLKTPDKGYVYLGRYDNGLTKIGMTTHPKTRDRYDSFKIFHAIRTDQKTLVEKRLHIHYQKQCMSGEVFRLSDRDIAELLSINEMEIGISHGDALFCNAIRQLSLKESGIATFGNHFGSHVDVRRVANVTHETIRALDAGAMALRDEGCAVSGMRYDNKACFHVAFCKSEGWDHVYENGKFSAGEILGL